MPKSSIDPIVIENLRNALEESGRSAYSVAKALGYAPNGLYQVLKGKNGILLPTLREIAAELGKSVSELVDDPTPAASKNGSPAVSAEAMMLGQRLADARKRAGLTQIDLAVALGYGHTQQMISLVERGERGLRSSYIAKAAEELGTSTDYLLGVLDDPTPAAERNGSPAVSANDGGYPVPEKHANIDTRPVAETKPGYNPKEANDQAGIWNLPIREVRPAAGSGADVFGEEVVGYVPFRADWLKERSIDPAQADVAQVSGDSMEPTLPDGCQILVDRSRRELQPKHIYVLRNEDGLVVKRVDCNRDGWWVISDNPAWLPVSLSEDTNIVGEVRWSAVTH